MGKRGQNNHLKRIAVPIAAAITNKKEHTWASKPNAGPHNGKHSVALSVLMRDILKLCRTNKEARTILNNRRVLIDGCIRTNEKFPLGLMDIVSLESQGKYYRLLVEKHGRLTPVEIEKKDTGEKIAKVTKKFTHKKGEIRVTLHDGKTIKADNNVKLGDSVIIDVPTNKIKKVLKLEEGATCFIKGGKHTGLVATIKEIIKTEKGNAKEAKMSHGKDEFITILNHLCVVDERIKGVSA